MNLHGTVGALPSGPCEATGARVSSSLTDAGRRACTRCLVDASIIAGLVLYGRHPRARE